MKRAEFWRRDWFLGLMASAVILVLANSDLLQSLERKAYDIGVGMTSRTPSDKVAVIAIDDQSIANLGRWPWSRELHARLTDRLALGQPKVIANTVFFSEPQLDPGYAYITQLIDIVNQARSDGAPPSAETEKIIPVLVEAELSLNTDRKLAQSYGKAGNILLPLLFELGEARGRPDQPLPEFVARSRLQQVQEGAGFALPAAQAQIPVEILGSKAVALGHLNSFQDVDGGVRTEPLVVQYFDQYYPALSLMIAAKSLNLGTADLRVRLGEEVHLGKLKILTDPATRMNTFFYKGSEGHPAFQVDSFYDVLSGKIPASKYAGKIVLIGATAAGVGSSQVTPVSPAMAPVVSMAHTVSSILSEHFFVSPPWAIWAEKVIFVLIALYLIAVLPRLSAAMGATVTATLLLLLIGAHFGLMTTQLTWLQLMVPATLLLFGHLLLTTKRFLVTERGKEKSDLDSAESNRMLGLAFQGQGQLDMAFDKFRKCPLDQAVMENLYNLGLDFERKRQFNKAEAVFRHMAGYDPKFRDIADRASRAKRMSDTVMLGTVGSLTNSGTLIVENSQVEKPMLGRYQVEKELGKGAMGVVYLGRDPKINRVVAIKTMALSQEFEGDELVEVKQRFFREAETAGRLNHQNIVTIFDAGEEHDLAYIAMEFLKGKDLVPHTKPNNLMPLAQVMGIAARVADALDYAHRNQVVHRDVKPANIMYEPTTEQVKVTDFGIARITDSSKTKTGMVLGTPSYMSPEQLAGKKIDGRSDLFSLGVTLYQLACGRLPFDGESMAQLMFRIATEPHPDIRDVRPDIPECLAVIIDRALIKDADKRYQTGAEMAGDLRDCLASAPGTAASQGRQP
jgi:eukaryotic-like serine/threonine-protein kinase